MGKLRRRRDDAAELASDHTVHKKTLRKLTAVISSHIVVGISATTEVVSMPALLTRMSICSSVALWSELGCPARQCAANSMFSAVEAHGG
jgi:hypothetical protein